MASTLPQTEAHVGNLVEEPGHELGERGRFAEVTPVVADVNAREHELGMGARQ